jgi:WD40 repeat protein
MSVAAGSPPTPFKGLAPFQDTELDAQLFCGRDREREVIVANLLASRLTVLYGASGVGKTSLLRAAVTPALRRIPDAAVVFYSSWAGDPRRGLGEAIDSAVGIESSGSLAERLAGASQVVGGDIYVILDQFEEYFLYHERDEFSDELAAAIREPGLRANLLFGLREDALAKLDAFKSRIPNLFANYLRLDHLDREGARAAILRPIERYNELTGETVEVESELVEAVLEQVAAGEVDVGRSGRGGVEKDKDRIEAPYLQLVLERLWQVERERGSSVLRLATLRELGGAESIVRAHLERALGSLPPAEQDVAATMFDHLVTPSGSKIAHRPRDLAQYAEVEEREVMPVLDALGRERIVRAVDGAGGGERYEIFHDVLADGVLAWRARRVIERDREQAQRRQRRLVAVAAGALIALGAMTAVAVYALTERSNARSAARLARAHALEATSLFEQATNPARALADAVAAARSDPGPRAERVLRQALATNHARRVLRVPKPVSAAAVASRGGRMLVGDAGGGLRVYSANGGLERTLAAAAPVTAASFSPDGTLVLGAAGRQALLWRAATGERFQTFHLPGVVSSAMFSRDGRFLLTTTGQGTTVWDTATGRPAAALEQRAAMKGAFSPDGRLVATLESAEHARVRVFDSRTGRMLHVLAPEIAHRRVELEGVAFSPDNHLLATTGFQGTYLWDARTGRQFGRRLVDRPGVATAAAFSPDGNLLAVAGQDGGVRIWDVAKGDRRFYFPAHNGAVFAVAWSPGGLFLADASADRTVHVLSANGGLGGRVVGNLVGHDAAVRAVAWSRNGRSLLSGSADGTARLWDTQFDQELLPLGGARGGSAVDASFDRAGRRIVSAGTDGYARIWSVGARHLLRALSHKAAVEAAEFSPDGRLVVTASADGTAGIWNPATGVRARTLHVGAPVSVARFGPDGTIVVTGDAGGGIRLWRTRDGKPLGAGKQQGKVTDAVFARDDRTVASAGLAGVSEWSVPSAKRIRVLKSTDGVSRVAFSPDGSLVAGAGNDGAARIWETDGGKRRALYKVSKAPLTDVAFSPDGRLLLATGLDVQTWDVRTGALRHKLLGHSGPASRGAFSPNGHWIATTGPITVGLWQRDADRPAPTPLRRAGPVPKGKLLTSASFSPDGRLVLASGQDGAVRLYRCQVCGDLPALLRLARARLQELRH